MVLEETATQAIGGCDGLSNRFVRYVAAANGQRYAKRHLNMCSGFWFLHTIGMVAEVGFQQVEKLAGSFISNLRVTSRRSTDNH
jgi:hypothetical protein